MNAFDSANYPTSEPTTLVAGDRWAWKRSDLTDYSPSLYSLTYEARLDGDGTDSISITANESGTEYLVEVASATTLGYTAGTWRWSAFITRTSDSQRVRIDSGTWEVKPDPASATDDPRSDVKILLDAVNSILQGRGTASDFDTVTAAFGSRSVTRDPAELRKWRAQLLAEYRAEQAAEAADAGRGGNTVRMSF